MKNDIAISVQNLSKSYKMYRSPTDRIKEFLHPGKKSFHQKFWALREVSFDIEKGTTFGIIGQNGSGKSTLLQLISGIIRPTNGSVTVNGRISALLELGAGFHRDFSGRENVFMQGALMGINREEMEKNFNSIEEFADIGEFIDQPVKTYSSGMYVRLAFATAVNIDPDILIIDEVLAVGDDMFRRRCFRRIEEFQEQGKTVLFVSHNLGTVTSICERALLLDKGEIIEVGSAKMIADTYTRLIAEKEETNLKKKSENNYLDKDYNRSKDERFEEPKDNSKPEYRYGTGDAKLLDVKMINEEGLFGNVFNQGDYFTMRISIQFNKYMKEPGAGYRIRTIKGVDVSGTNTFITGKSIGEVNSGDIVTIEFKQIMILNPGSYSLSSGVVENIMDRQIVHDRRMDVIVFKVIGKLRSTGIFDIGSEIKVTLDKIDDKGVKASKN